MFGGIKGNTVRRCTQVGYILIRTWKLKEKSLEVWRRSVNSVGDLKSLRFHWRDTERTIISFWAKGLTWMEAWSAVIHLYVHTVCKQQDFRKAWPVHVDDACSTAAVKHQLIFKDFFKDDDNKEDGVHDTFSHTYIYTYIYIYLHTHIFIYIMKFGSSRFLALISEWTWIPYFPTFASLLNVFMLEHPPPCSGYDIFSFNSFPFRMNETLYPAAVHSFSMHSLFFLRFSSLFPVLFSRYASFSSSFVSHTHAHTRVSCQPKTGLHWRQQMFLSLFILLCNKQKIILASKFQINWMSVSFPIFSSFSSRSDLWPSFTWKHPVCNGKFVAIVREGQTGMRRRKKTAVFSNSRKNTVVDNQRNNCV